MGNWWDVITQPIQQAVQNVQQTVSNIVAPPSPQPTQTSQSGGYSGGGGAGYTSVLINPATNQGIGTPVQIYSAGGGSYVPTPQSIVSSIQSIPQQLVSGIQNLPQTIGIAAPVQALPAQGVQPQFLPTPFVSQAPSGYAPSMINLQSLPGLAMNSLNPQTFGLNSGMTLNVAYGDQAQQQVKNINAVVYDPISGGWSGYTTPYGHSISNIVTGGGAGSLQSGKFTIGEGNALTPVLYTQEGAYKGQLVPGANVAAANMVLSNPSGYSNTGAERYGGIVAPLIGGEEGKLRAGIDIMGMYPAASGNMANLVSQQGVNQPKTTWTDTPWNISPTVSGVFALQPKEGNLSTSAWAGVDWGVPLEKRMALAMENATMPSDRLVGGKTVAGNITTLPNAGLDMTPTMVAVSPKTNSPLDIALGAFGWSGASGLEQTPSPAQTGWFSGTTTFGAMAANALTGLIPQDLFSGKTTFGTMAAETVSGWISGNPRTPSLPSLELTTPPIDAGAMGVSAAALPTSAATGSRGFIDTLVGGMKYYTSLGGEGNSPLSKNYSPSGSMTDLTARLERSGSASAGFVAGFYDMLLDVPTLGGWSKSGMTFGQNQVVTPEQTRPIGEPIITASPETTTVTPFGGNQTISDLSSWLKTNEGKIDLTNPEQVNQWNLNAETFSRMQKENPSGFNTVITGGNVTTQKYETIPAVVNKYGFFDTLGVWAGGEVNRLFYGGMTPDQVAAKERQAESKQGAEWLSANAEVGFQKTVTGKPTELLWYVPLGAGLAAAESAVVGGMTRYGATTLPGSTFVRTAMMPVVEAAPGAMPIAQTFRDQALGWGYRHGGQILLAALATDIVTEHGTASPAKTMQNIGGAIPGAMIVAGSWSLSSGVGIPRAPEMPDVPASRGRGGVGGSGSSGGMGTANVGEFGSPRVSGAFDYGGMLKTVAAFGENYGTKGLMGAGEVPVYNEITKSPTYNEVSQSTISKEEVKSYLPASMYLPATPVYTEKVATDFINQNQNPTANKYVNPTALNYDNPNAYWWDNPNRFVTAEPTKNQYGTPTKNQYGNPSEYAVILPTSNEFGFPTRTPYETPNPYRVVVPYVNPDIVVNRIAYENPNPVVTRYEYEKINRTNYDRITPASPVFPGLPLPPFGGGGGGAGGSPKNKQRAKFTDIYRYGQGIGNFGSVNPIRFSRPSAPVKQHKKK